MAKAAQGPGGPNGSEFKAALAKCTQCQQAHMKQIMAAGQDNAATELGGAATPTKLMPYWKGAGFSSLGDCLARGPIGNCRDTWRGITWVPCGGSYCPKRAVVAATELGATWQETVSASPYGDQTKVITCCNKPGYGPDGGVGAQCPCEHPVTHHDVVKAGKEARARSKEAMKP